MFSGAFCVHAPLFRAGHVTGPLAGLRFAVKDVFAVAGHSACFGNPDWLATHPPAVATAPVVERLLGTGATLAGATITDELAFSLTGENAHYGTPPNPAAPDRVPGGSSSGSASAVAAGLVDFALGTDTGGSVRVPASHCGIHGLRPTHGAVSAAGVLPFSPRFDTVGWFARDADMLAKVGGVLLPGDRHAGAVHRARVLADAFALVEPAVRGPLRARAATVLAVLGLEADEVTVGGDGGPGSWLSTYATLQGAEVAQVHRGWIEAAHPRFGSLIGRRVAGALAIEAGAVAHAEGELTLVRARLAALLGDDAVLVLPSAAGVAPLRGQPDERVDADTGPSLALAALASLGGLPQLSLPVFTHGGLPLGLSLIAAPGRDRLLLALARRLGRAAAEHAPGC
jgi:amidase